MNRSHNFSAGPAVLPLEVIEKTKAAVEEYANSGMSIMEMSHRSKEIVAMFDEAIDLCLKLMNLTKDEYSVLFLGGGASLQFLTVPQNFLRTNADYVNTGTWAKKAIAEAKRFGKVNVAGSSAESNFNFIPKDLNLNPEADYLHFTSNNTIFGTRFNSIPECGDVPLICDMSSDIFSRPLDFSKFSLIYAGAQKNIGPAGATLVVVKKSFLEKQREDIPTMLDYKTHIENDTMFNTPPVLPVYAMKCTFEWLMNNGGLEKMEAHNNIKAALIYDAIDNSNGFYKGSVSDKVDRSIMNITFNLATEDLENKFIKEATALNMSGLKGHRSVGGVRASVYNALPMESAQALADFMETFRKNNA